MAKFLWLFIAFIVPNTVFLYVYYNLIGCSHSVNDIVKSKVNIVASMPHDNLCFSSLLIVIWITFLPALYIWWYYYFLRFNPPLVQTSRLKIIIAVFAMHMLFFLALQIDLESASRRNYGFVSVLTSEKYLFLVFFSVPFCFLSVLVGRIFYFLRKGV